MFNLPTPMRKAIAALPEIEEPQIKALLELEPEPLQAALDKMARQLKARGNSPLVVAAYQALAPLLRENKAVKAYQAKTGSSEAARALVDLNSAEEAVALATQEYRLDSKEQAQLLKLMQAQEPDS